MEAAEARVLGSRSGALLARHGIRDATVAAALGVTRPAVWNWVTCTKVPSRHPRSAGLRFLRVLAALEAADTHQWDAEDELAVMDNEAYGERWAHYQRRWIWGGPPEDPRVIRAPGGRRDGVLLRDGVPQPRGTVDPARDGVAPRAHR